MFDLRRLEAFVAFAGARSFTRAARLLHVTQPAVHQQVAKLEEELGVALYTRVGSTLALTPEGERVAAFGRDLDAGARALAAEIRDEVSVEPVVLAAGEGTYLYLLRDAIRAFVGAGSAPLRLLTRDREGALRAVREGEAHVAVTTVDAQPSNGGGLSWGPLGDVPQVVALPRRHPLAKKRRLRPADLEGAKLVVPPADRPHRAMIEAVLARRRVAWEPAVEATGWEVILEFVRLGLGLAVVNACCRMPAGIVARPVDEFPSIAYASVTRRAIASHPSSARLEATLRAHRDAWRTRVGLARR